MTDIKAAIERRIEFNHANGLQFLEGQTVAHGISLETACELAEYLERALHDEALTVIAKLPQRDVIGRIYCAIADFDWQPDFESCDEIEFHLSDLLAEVEA